jgi:hypothetical protein
MHIYYFIISLRQAHPNGTNQADYARASSRAPAPALPQMGGRVLIYDLDDVPKVAMYIMSSIRVYTDSIFALYVSRCLVITLMRRRTSSRAM